jgi:hypothetical protein
MFGRMLEEADIDDTFSREGSGLAGGQHSIK